MFHDFCLRSSKTKVMKHFGSAKLEPNAVELQWLEQTWDHENQFQPKLVIAIQGLILYKLTSRDPSGRFIEPSLFEPLTC